MRGLLVPLLAGVLSVALAGCGASQRGDDSDWTPEIQQKHKRLREPESLFGARPLDPAEKGITAIVGVRHDLMLSASPHEARCACLSVEVGSAGDPNFFWAGGAPDVSPDALSIAVGARGIACPGGDPDDRRRRPSISAVDVEGDDIVVEVEDLPQGRPLASGAIIPRPGSKGSIYVRPRKGNLVYGRNPGVARCRVR
jgi:hypothetical protein